MGEDPKKLQDYSLLSLSSCYIYLAELTDINVKEQVIRKLYIRPIKLGVKGMGVNKKLSIELTSR